MDEEMQVAFGVKPEKLDFVLNGVRDAVVEHGRQQGLTQEERGGLGAEPGVPGRGACGIRPHSATLTLQTSLAA